MRNCKGYILRDRDPELEDGEYYVKDTAGRVVKGRLVNILPCNTSYCSEGVTYGLVNAKGQHISAGTGSDFIGFTKSEMYDNRDDCREDAHIMFSRWEDFV